MVEQVLVARIAQVLVGLAPSGWVGVQAVHRAAGGRTETEATALVDGRAHELTLPPGLPGLFTELREAAPSWFSARVRVVPPGRFALDTDADEPRFAGPAPTWRDYAADAAVLAVEPDARPGWVRSQLAVVPVVGAVSATLRAAGLPDHTVQVGSSGGAGWHVVRRAGGWRAELEGAAVGAPLEHVRDAAALALGRVLLARGAGEGQQRSAEPVRAAGPIVPLPGEPPLSLLRGVRGVTLPVGTEVDRLGGGEGNVVWVARTPFALRSLPEEFTTRPWAAYVLRRPVEVLTGEAVPWFGQPGGGTAFVLPLPVDHLVADGVLDALG